MTEFEATTKVETTASGLTPEREAAIRAGAAAGNVAIPERYNDVDAYLKGIAEMEAHNTRLAQENAALRGSKPTPPAPVTKPNTADDLGSMVEGTTNAAADGKMNWDAVKIEMQETGSLSPATQAAMVDAGVPKELIDSQIEAAKIRMQNDMREASELVGGKENLEAILNWHKENLSPEDAAAVASQLRGPGWKVALKGMAAQFSEAGNSFGGNEPGQINTTSAAGGVGGFIPGEFTSQAQVSAAMRDPRYNEKISPDYYKEVVVKTRRFFASTRDKRGNNPTGFLT